MRRMFSTGPGTNFAVIILLLPLLVGCRRYQDEPISLAVYVGSQIDLPCRALLADDLPQRIHWYKDDSPLPVYSVTYDGTAHRANIMQGRHSARSDWTQRAYFSVLGSPATLKVNDLSYQDSGTYICQVIISRATQRNATLHLVVVGPLKLPVIRDGRGRTKNDIVGPYFEGDELSLTCETPGGKPTPAITWFKNGKVIESSTLSFARGNIRSDVVIPVLTRSDLLAIFSCQVSNNISAAVSSSVKLDMILRPLLAVIRRGDMPLSADIPVEIVCEAMGSRPPATLTWWRNGAQLNQTFTHVSADGNVTTSVVTFTPTNNDNGLQLMCRAQNPILPGAIAEDVWIMRIFFKPVVVLQLGPPFYNASLIEGSDVFLECKAQANPPVTSVGWRRDGKLDVSLDHDIAINDNFLAIQHLRRHHSGNYSCFASNSEGSSESNWLELRVQHTPVCKHESPVVYVGSRNDEVQIVCETVAHPERVTFHWSFKDSSGGRPIYSGYSAEHAKLMSVMHYAPMLDADFGTLLCLANNSVGYQKEPCVFHVVQARPPEPLRNCRVTNLTETSFVVLCGSETDGVHDAMNTTYVLELYSFQQTARVLNASSTMPAFSVRHLTPGTEYFIVLYGVNRIGESNAVKMYASTLASPEALLDTEPGWAVLGLGVYSTVLVVLLIMLFIVTIIMILVLRRWKRSRARRGKAASQHERHCLATIDRTGKTEGYSGSEEVMGLGGLPEQGDFVLDNSVLRPRTAHCVNEVPIVPAYHGHHNGIRLQTFSRDVV
ncbi:roundabout homolog 1-like isoform X2 [Ornithodoros turicata]|uniref:roundabout homolog 1-like isoform X2 n=1 Tax=Ornithodoros turicata TaxID=34597 RepID=UPI003138FF95